MQLMRSLKNKIILIVTLMTFLSFGGLLFRGTYAYAQSNIPDRASEETKECELGATDCEIEQDCELKGEDKELNENNCKIINRLLDFINILSGLVGVVVVAVIIVGGIQYTTSGGDPQKVSGAKKRIANALLALAIYLFFYAALQWLVPGGIF